MSDESNWGSWEWLLFWCNVRARVTGERQRIYHNRVGGRWLYWSTAASAGYGSWTESVVREMEAQVRGEQ